MPELSIVIPARNEEWLAKTCEDILQHRELDTEVIVVLDGDAAGPPIDPALPVTVIKLPTSIGQRAACNLAARAAKGRYIMKLDAHCAVDQGFDKKLLADMQDDWTMVPVMRNLHVFDWVCPDGHRRYQGPSGPCQECGKETTKDVVWNPKTNPQSTSYCVDSEPHFQYFNEYKQRPEYQPPFTETMSLQGSCFLITRERYFALNVCDEDYGSWGTQGWEVAAKSWLSGGRVVCNHHTWYGHCFRTQGGDFGFPYNISGRQTNRAKKLVGELFFENKWPLQVRPLSWLLDKFWPVRGWTDEARAKITEAGHRFMERKGIVQAEPCISEPKVKPTPKKSQKPKASLVYYTDNRLPPLIQKACQAQLDRCRDGRELITVSLQPLDWQADRSILYAGARGQLTMFQQILAGIEAAESDVVHLVEHDVLYAPSHFEFVPPSDDKFWYDENEWNVFAEDGHALFYHCSKVSMLCANRQLLLKHYRKRVERVAKDGFSLRLGYEPGNHKFPRGVDEYGRDVWWAPQASIDIRHKQTLTPNRRKQEQFRNKGNLHSWTEAGGVPGWQPTEGRFQEFLQEVIAGTAFLGG